MQKCIESTELDNDSVLRDTGKDKVETMSLKIVLFPELQLRRREEGCGYHPCVLVKQ